MGHPALLLPHNHAGGGLERVGLSLSNCELPSFRHGVSAAVWSIIELLRKPDAAGKPGAPHDAFSILLSPKFNRDQPWLHGRVSALWAFGKQDFSGRYQIRSVPPLFGDAQKGRGHR